MPLPTRVLDLGDQKTAKICLFVPDEGTVGKYAALSYCWGRSNHFVLTTATMEDRKKGFDVGELPGTLQDAVEVSRQIGLRYLWVDALCIIQGQDAEATNDWNAEVGRMGTVYRNAYVTISAAAAQDCSGGLFCGSYCDLPFLRRQTSEGHEEVVSWARVRWWNDAVNFKSEPLNSRAWALQEDLLSTRVLFYASFGLLWKCNEELRWVCTDRPIKRHSNVPPQAEAEPNDHPNRFMFSAARYKHFIPRDGQPEAEFWGDILELYTARNLSKPHDKLPALAAIAQRYSHSKGTKYLAGLWKSTFRQDLLWHHHPVPQFTTVSDGGNPMRRDEYRAPSWSWAAVDGVVRSIWTGRTSNSRKFEWLAEVTVYPEPELVDLRNPFGGVLRMAAQLQMRGPVETFDVPKYPQRISVTDIISATGIPTTGRLLLDDTTETAIWRGREMESLFCLHILSDLDKNKGSGMLLSLALLAVREQPDTYVRIGKAEILPDSPFPGKIHRDLSLQTVTIL